MANRTLDEDGLQRLADLLDADANWPLDYLFKFIVPSAQVDQVKALFPPGTVSIRESRTGKYQSVSVTLSLPDSVSVVEVYRQAALIPGLMAL